MDGILTCFPYRLDLNLITIVMISFSADMSLLLPSARG